MPETKELATVEGRAMVKYDPAIMGAPVRTVEAARALLVVHEDDLRAALPAITGISPHRMISTAIQAIAANPDILKCTGRSILNSVRDAAECGLSFSKVFKHAHLVPFYNKEKQVYECQLMLGWQGLVDLVRRACDMTLDADAVYEGDVFEVVKGNDPKLTHRPRLSDAHDAKNLTHVYAVAYPKTPPPIFRWMTRSEVNAIRARSKKPDGPAWTYSFAQMAIKTVIKQLAKYLPMSAENARLVERAFERDNEDAGFPAAEPAESPADAAARLKAELEAPPEVVPETPPTPSADRQKLYDLIRAIAASRKMTFDDLWATVVTKAGNLDPGITIQTITDVVTEAFLKMAEKVVAKEKIDPAPYLPGGPEHQELHG